MKKFILPIVSLLATVFSAGALELTLTPGALSANLEQLRYMKDDALILSGNANVTDLELLKYVPQSVSRLDMSGLSLNAYKYASGNYMGITDFAENELPPYIFVGANFSEIILPSNLEIIGQHAFAGSAVENMQIPASVADIRDFAFADCDKISTVDISKVRSLGVGVFKGCDALTQAVLPSQITYVPDYTFDGCLSFANAVPLSVTNIGDYAYRSTAFEILHLENVKEIGEYSFADMPNLRTVIFSDDFVVKTSTGSFFNDPAIASLPRINSDLAPLLFSHSSGEARYYINSEVIGDGAFANATGVDTIHLGTGVRQIQKNAFRNVSTLDMIDVKSLAAKVPEVDEASFSGLENDNGRYDIKLNIAPGTENAWKEHPVWSLFNIGAFYTGVDTPLVSDVEIAISHGDNFIRVRSSANIDLLEIYSTDGKCLNTVKGADSEISVDCDLSEPVIVRAFSGGIVKIEKIL